MPPPTISSSELQLRILAVYFIFRLIIDIVLHAVHDTPSPEYQFVMHHLEELERGLVGREAEEDSEDDNEIELEPVSGEEAGSLD